MAIGGKFVGTDPVRRVGTDPVRGGDRPQGRGIHERCAGAVWRKDDVFLANRVFTVPIKYDILRTKL